MYRLKLVPANSLGSETREEVNASRFECREGLVQFYRAGWGDTVFYAVPLVRVLSIELRDDEVEIDAVDAEPAGVS